MKKLLTDESADLMSKVDLVAWEALRKEYEDKFNSFGEGRHPEKDFRCEQNYSKFFDLEKFILYHLRLVRLLGLDTEPESKRILDIGCGSGIFLYICQCYGHHGVGLEVDSEMYLKMADVLNVKLRISPVLTYEEQPDDLVGFDVISAIAIKFDRLDWGPQSKTQWKLEEWQFFLNDMAKRLNAGGRIFLKPNYTVKPSKDAPGYFFEDDRIEKYLTSIASEMTPTEFIIAKESILSA